MVLTPRDIRTFQTFIFSWWEKNRRDLPWRHTHDPYRILVSEVMLQQTQVSRVIAKYDEFLCAFPDVSSLSHATPAAVLRVWRGMGYNRRALYLKKMAETVVSEYGGVFPKHDTELVQLPGLGMYTARAICIFAYKQDIATVDTNIRKIITHVFFADIPQKPSIIEAVATALIPKGKSWEWHQALMDYGALELRKLPRQQIGPEKRPSAVPFHESKRFFRGRIIDDLRAGAKRTSEMVIGIAEAYHLHHDEIAHIIETLKREGLIVEKEHTLSLPE